MGTVCHGQVLSFENKKFGLFRSDLAGLIHTKQTLKSQEHNRTSVYGEECTFLFCRYNSIAS